MFSISIVKKCHKWFGELLVHQCKILLACFLIGRKWDIFELSLDLLINFLIAISVYFCCLL